MSRRTTFASDRAGMILRTRTTLKGLLIILLSTTHATTASAQITYGDAAAILTYPLVTVDASNGIDTSIHLTNSSAFPVDVKCFYQDATGRCVANDATRCTEDAHCPSGDSCSTAGAAVGLADFTIGLTARQPIAWSASQGAAVLPHPQNTGTIPPIADDPFSGVLRCTVLDSNGSPADQNVLVGSAALERYESDPMASIDLARYNALGTRALPGANDGDNELVLGGPDAEYEACPGAERMNNVFDFAIEPITHLDQVFTKLILVSCTADLFTAGTQSEQSVVAFEVFNEFEQKFTTSRLFRVQHSSDISLIDTAMPQRSIFAATVAGTLTGQVVVSSIDRGIIGVAIERHERVAQPEFRRSAAFHLHPVGAQEDHDSILIGAPPLCGREPAASCRVSPKARLEIRDSINNSRAEVSLKLGKLPSTSKAELGDPTDTTHYAVCLYAGPNAEPLAALEMPASNNWTEKARAFSYADDTGTADGVTKVFLRSSERDRARIRVSASGAALPDIHVQAPLVEPVLVQVVNDTSDVCWERSFIGTEISSNGAGRFKAKSSH